MSGIFIDTNIFYNVLFKTKLTETVKRLLEKHEEEQFCISQIVIMSFSI